MCQAVKLACSYFVAEVAQMLARNVNYEVPALKRQVAKCKKAQQDCTRKEGEYNSLALELKKKYQDMSTHYGIQVCICRYSHMLAC